MIKSFNDFGALGEAKVVNPRTITVVRVRPQPTDEDTPPENWQWELSRTQAIARSWMAECYPILEKNDRKSFDFVEFINEPDPADAPAMERAATFVQYCMEDAEAHGYKTAIWAWTAGLPRTPRIKPGEFAQMEATLETLKWAAEHGHALAVHEGSVDPERRMIQQAADDGTALRYRLTAQMLREKGWPMPHVVITEAYQESGYRRPDWADWKWYLSELAKDDYVLGCAWFTLGDWSFGEDNVNIQGQLPKFAQAVSELPEVVDVPTTPTPAVLKLAWPTDCRPAFITQTFVQHPYRDGIDIRTGVAGKILSATSGIVLSADGNHTDYGNCVVVKVDDDRKVFYAHLSVIQAKVGQVLMVGDVLGVAGSTGNSTAVHLHLGLRVKEVLTDPEPFLVWPIDPPPPTTTLKGLHMRAGGPCRDSDFQCIRIAGIEAAKLTTENPPETVDRLTALGILPINIVVRLFAEMSDRVVTPEEFCDWMSLPIQLFTAKGVRYFEVHNEPNLQQEGLGVSWQNAFGFAAWYFAVMQILRRDHPDVKVGFPGLSPQPNVTEWLTACDNVMRSSDWIGVHCYWTDASLMSHPEHGGYWQRFAEGFPGREIMIAEFSNPQAAVSKAEKGRQYGMYYAQLPARVRAAFCFISSSPAFPCEAWVDEAEHLSDIPYNMR